MVISLLTVQLRGIEDKDAADALREAITRVGAIAACHLALQGSEDLKRVDFAVTLKELCGHFAQLHPAITIICSPIEALMLDADRAIPLGLAVSEVVTNALRHAFPGRETGHVTVEAVTETPELIVRVSDDGVGIPQPEGSAGLGSRIIRALAVQLSAKVQVESASQTGTIVTLRMPLTQSLL
jgi:two-component sensor histidine kinase